MHIRYIYYIFIIDYYNYVLHYGNHNGGTIECRVLLEKTLTFTVDESRRSMFCRQPD
jgi:hypothetical protein